MNKIRNTYQKVVSFLKYYWKFFLVIGGYLALAMLFVYNFCEQISGLYYLTWDDITIAEGVFFVFFWVIVTFLAMLITGIIAVIIIYKLDL